MSEAKSDAANVDTPEFARLLLAWHEARIDKARGTDVSKEANAIVAHVARLCSQQREAGRRERDQDFGLLKLVLEQTQERLRQAEEAIASRDAATIGRQPVSAPRPIGEAERVLGTRILAYVRAAESCDGWMEMKFVGGTSNSGWQSLISHPYPNACTEPLFFIPSPGTPTEGKKSAAPIVPCCTCPSGDGSLRWPCPKHPPE